MIAVTTESSYEFMDYSQLTYEEGIWVIQEYDLSTKTVKEKQIDGDVLAIVNN